MEVSAAAWMSAEVPDSEPFAPLIYGVPHHPPQIQRHFTRPTSSISQSLSKTFGRVVVTVIVEKMDDNLKLSDHCRPRAIDQSTPLVSKTA